MRPAIPITALQCLLLCASAVAQQQVRELKGGGHTVGETAEQFFSVGFVGQLGRACQEKDWKAVNNLAKPVERVSKASAQEVCVQLTKVKREAISGARQEYAAGGDVESMRTDTFTLEGGRLVKIQMLYTMPTFDTKGFTPRSFDMLYDGLRGAYGEPSKSSSESVVDTFGVRRDARRAIWFGEQDVIRIIEQPGPHSQTHVIAETLAEFKREEQAPKNANPLQ